MALLTKEAENNIIGILVAEGLVDSNLVQSVRTEVEGSGSGQSVLGELIRRGVANEDMVARATAMLIGVPYVELKNVTIEQDILSMIPQDAQVRELAIPLGEKDGMELALKYGCDAVFIDESGNITVTDNIKDRIEITDENYKMK